MCEVDMSPGKFEGESCITVLGAEMANQGLMEFDPDDYGTDDSNVLSWRGSFLSTDFDYYLTNVCVECRAEFMAGQGLRYWEDEQGFAHSQVL